MWEMIGESETSQPYKEPKGTTLLSTLRPGLQTSLWRNLNEPETSARKLEGRLEKRIEAELRGYEFLTKNWYKKIGVNWLFLEERPMSHI